MNIAISFPLVPLVDLRAYSCHWPVGDPLSEDFGFCGKPSHPGKSYCDKHCGMAYQTPVERMPSKVEIAARPSDRHEGFGPITIWRPKKATAESPVEVQPITIADVKRAAKARQARYAMVAAELAAELARVQAEKDRAEQAELEKRTEEQRRAQGRFYEEIRAKIAELTQKSGYAEIPSIRIRSIIEIVGRHFGVTPLDIVSHRRTKKDVLPRHVAMYLARRMSTRSLPEIGRLFGNKDHTTLMFAVRKIEGLLASGDEAIKAHVSAIVAKVEAARPAPVVSDAA